MNYKNEIKNGEISVFVDQNLYSKELILRSLYWFGDKFHTNLSLDGNNNFCISLVPLNNSVKEDELNYYLQKLERDLVDYQLREVITNETINIRELLIAKAFSNGEFDEEPPGDIADPVGFNPESVKH